MSTAEELEDFVRRTIPMARFMEVRIADHDAHCVRLHAPLAPNINDKGCAFGGSLGGLMTMAGWALVNLAMRARDVTAAVYVANTQTRFLAPLTGDLEATARLASDADWARFFAVLAARGKAQIWVEAAVAGDGGDACTQRARFVAFQKTEDRGQKTEL